MRVVLRALPSGTEPKHETAITNLVEGRGHLGEHRRRPERHRSDSGRESHLIRYRGDCTQRGIAFELRNLAGSERRKEVIIDRNGIESAFVRPFCSSERL